MACPFLLGRAVFGSSSTKNTASQASKCPFGFGKKKGDEEEQVPDKEADEQPPSPQALLQPTPTSPTKAVCPYGYTSNSPSGPTADITCLLCKCLYFDCVRLGCGHSFCRCCIARWQACPSCGADIVQEGSKPDSHLQGRVDKFLAAHLSVLAAAQEDPHQLTGQASSPTAASPSAQLAEAPSVLLPAPVLGSTPSPAAAFALQLGLQALRGGNPAAALDRLETCKRKLLETLPADAHAQQNLSQQALTDLPASVCGDMGSRVLSEPPTVEADSGAVHLPVWNLLGAVYGSQGDACKQLGALRSAARLYTASTVCLLHVADQQDDEGMHALSVSVNKLGDVQYMTQDLQAAGLAYERALRLRRVRLQRALAGPKAQQAVTGASTQPEQPQQSHINALPDEELLSYQDMAIQLHPGCAEQALDVVASCIKVADAASGCNHIETAKQACSDAHLLLTACMSTLQQHAASPEGAPEPLPDEEDRDSAHGSGRVSKSSSKAGGEHEAHSSSSSPKGQAALMARCQQLQAVLTQLEQSLH